MKSFIILASLILFSSSALAANFTFDADGSEPLYQTTLTKEVYQFSNNDQLQDISISNAAGEVVPYALVPYKNIHQQTKVIKKSEPLVIFPMQEETLNQAGITNIQLNSHDNSTSVNVTSEDSKVTSKTYYLFDLGKEHLAFQKLTLDWQGHDGQLLTIDVMSSNNLNNWVNAGEASLLKVTANDQVIIQNSITFNRLIKARYLKILPQETTDAFSLTSVNLEFSQVEALTQPTLWQEIPLSQRNKGNSETHIDFESPSRYPASFLSIKLPQQNTITHASVLTRNNKEKPWRLIKKTSLYRLNKQGHDYTNKDIPIPTTAARYWRLSFNQANGGLGKENPQLSLGWRPKVLVWNARGSGPFTLHVGDTNTAVNSVSITNLLKPYSIQKLKELPTSNLSLTSSDQTFNAWHAAVDYKRFWLWGGLFLGVLALAVMAFSLVKNNPNNK